MSKAIIIAFSPLCHLIPMGLADKFDRCLVVLRQHKLVELQQHRIPVCVEELINEKEEKIGIIDGILLELRHMIALAVERDHMS